MARAGLSLTVLCGFQGVDSLSCLHFQSSPVAEGLLPPGHALHQVRVQEGHTVPSGTALELPVTGASERMTLAIPGLALELRHDSTGFRTRAADVAFKASMLLSEAGLAPSLAPWGILAVGARAGGQDEEPASRMCYQKVALWSFTALASARACSQSSDPHGMAAVGAHGAFRR